MKLFKLFNDLRFKLFQYYQNIQHLMVSIMVLGILEYFFLYELLIALLPIAIEAGPILIVILIILAVRGFIRYSRRKAQENRHLMLFSF